MLCWLCQKRLCQENTTDAFSEIRGEMKVHFACAGIAQDFLDDEFNEREDEGDDRINIETSTLEKRRKNEPRRNAYPVDESV